MTQTTKKWLKIAAFVVALWLLGAWLVFGGSFDANAVVQHEGIVVREVNAVEYRGDGDTQCTRYPNGKRMLWALSVYRRGSVPELYSWRFGGGLLDPHPWVGYWCYNANHVWSIDWGGEPHGWAEWLLLWQYDAGDTHLVKSDTEGDIREKVWQGHFHASYTWVTRHCFPRLGVKLWPNGDTDLSSTGFSSTRQDNC